MSLQSTAADHAARRPLTTAASATRAARNRSSQGRAPRRRPPSSTRSGTRTSPLASTKLVPPGAGDVLQGARRRRLWNMSGLSEDVGRGVRDEPDARQGIPRLAGESGACLSGNRTRRYLVFVVRSTAAVMRDERGSPRGRPCNCRQASSIRRPRGGVVRQDRPGRPTPRESSVRRPGAPRRPFRAARTRTAVGASTVRPRVLPTG